MEPIAVTVRGERRWMLIHRCTRCGRLRMNRTAGDDNVLLLMQLAALPLARRLSRTSARPRRLVTASRPQPGPADTRPAPRGRRIGQRAIAPLSGNCGSLDRGGSC